MIELIDIHKHYGTLRANDGISLTIEDGAVHAVLGENGAGKSTLMKILAGYIPKTSGRIIVNGTPVSFSSTRDAADAGIGMLYQDPMDFPQLTVIENFMIGQARGLFIRNDRFVGKFYRIANSLGFSLDPDRTAASLTVGERQQLELIRLLSLGRRVLILDEPTTGISDTQKDILFTALTRLTEQGKSIVLVSHKLEDVAAFCDRITVLRQGRVSGHMTRPFNTSALLSMMFDAPSNPPKRHRPRPGPLVLSMDKVSARGGRTGLHRLSVNIHEQEIIGLAGLEGSGQDVFLRVASGLVPLSRGALFVDNEDFSRRSHVDFQRAGIAFLPSSRLEEGLIPGLSLMDHHALGSQPPSFFLSRRRIDRQARQAIDAFQIKAQPRSRVETLSGGNQQRLLLSLLPPRPRLLLLEQPTRGLDLSSAYSIWTKLQSLCLTDRTAIVFTSSELDEIMMVAHRILVFYDGVMVLDRPTQDTSVRELGAALSGKDVSF
ncbi:ATP-binding cassette domain-containing protein [Desulfatiferula olefinivorans]